MSGFQQKLTSHAKRQEENQNKTKPQSGEMKQASQPDSGMTQIMEHDLK